MRDFLAAGLIYVPAWFIGRALCNYVPTFDPYDAGWLIGCAAFAIRMMILERRRQKFTA